MTAIYLPPGVIYDSQFDTSPQTCDENQSSSPEPPRVCICPMPDLMTVGCKCGAMQDERELTLTPESG